MFEPHWRNLSEKRKKKPTQYFKAGVICGTKPALDQAFTLPFLFTGRWRPSVVIVDHLWMTIGGSDSVVTDVLLFPQHPFYRQ